MRHIKNLEWHYFQSAEEAAKAAYLALQLDCREAGEDPSWEVQIYTPEESQKRGYTEGWHVVWECGPESWAVGESMRMISGGVIPPWGFCETYWGFDLTFLEEGL